jgi:hypothetical protein
MEPETNFMCSDCAGKQPYVPNTVTHLLCLARDETPGLLSAAIRHILPFPWGIWFCKAAEVLKRSNLSHTVGERLQYCIMFTNMPQPILTNQLSIAAEFLRRHVISRRHTFADNVRAVRSTAGRCCSHISCAFTKPGTLLCSFREIPLASEDVYSSTIRCQLHH